MSVCLEGRAQYRKSETGLVLDGLGLQPGTFPGFGVGSVAPCKVCSEGDAVHEPIGGGCD
jgi:hypothetical protein